MEEGETIEVFSHPRKPVTKSFIETAGSIGKIYDLIAEDSPITRLLPGQKMYLLTYSTDTTKEAIISYVSRTYDVDASVSFGNVEVLKDKPLGKLVVIFSGREENIEKALQYIRDAGIETEELK